MKNSQALLYFITTWEGVSLAKYKDIAGHETIGVGHLIKQPADFNLRTITGIESENVHILSQPQVTELLALDMLTYVTGVDSLVKVELTQFQFDALVSFAFNLGVSSLESSTLLRYLNNGDYDKAADEFIRWKKAGGKVVNGLYLRRIAEYCLFKNTTNIPFNVSIEEEIRIVDIVANYKIRYYKSIKGVN